jgi:hypothetical protein
LRRSLLAARRLHREDQGGQRAGLEQRRDVGFDVYARSVRCPLTSTPAIAIARDRLACRSEDRHRHPPIRPRGTIPTDMSRLTTRATSANVVAIGTLHESLDDVLLRRRRSPHGGDHGDGERQHGEGGASGADT